MVDADNIAHAREVKIGHITTDYAEVMEGLKEAEQAVSENMAKLKDGDKVDIIEVQEASL